LAFVSAGILAGSRDPLRTAGFISGQIELRVVPSASLFLGALGRFPFAIGLVDLGVIFQHQSVYGGGGLAVSAEPSLGASLRFGIENTRSGDVEFRVETRGYGMVSGGTLRPAAAIAAGIAFPL
jgi:hypothetical protein